MPRTGRPKKEYDAKAFVDLIGLGCGAEEICWWFRDEKGKPANIDTLSRWCKREFGCTFQEFRTQNGSMNLKIKLRRNQLVLSEKSAAMAIFLGKQYLGQKDNPIEVTHVVTPIDEITKEIFRIQSEQSELEEQQSECQVD